MGSRLQPLVYRSLAEVRYLEDVVDIYIGGSFGKIVTLTLCLADINRSWVQALHNF
jgi:hypothetical protein